MTREDEARQLLAVTQVDREAAADLLKGGWRFDVLWHPQIREGERDDHVIVQAFAKHRLAATRPSSPASGELERLREACMKQNEIICQTLGKALGYPWFKDDPENFPDATEAHGVCVGDHVAETLAAEAAERLAALTVPARPVAGEVVGQHKWEPSPYGHGEQRCAYCLATNREIAIIGDLNSCDKAPTARADIGEDAVEGVARLKEALEIIELFHNFETGKIRRSPDLGPKFKERVERFLASLQSSSRDAGEGM